MKNTTRLAALAAILFATACATAQTPVAATPAATPDGAAALSGAWTVDLSSEPGQPYTRPMHLTLNADGTATGDFYESEILAGRWKTDRGRTCVSFRTTDGVGPYHTAACLVVDSRGGERVEGQTWAEQRNFLFNWNAVRERGHESLLPREGEKVSAKLTDEGAVPAIGRNTRLHPEPHPLHPVFDHLLPLAGEKGRRGREGRGFLLNSSESVR